MILQRNAKSYFDDFLSNYGTIIEPTKDDQNELDETVTINTQENVQLKSRKKKFWPCTKRKGKPKIKPLLSQIQH